MRKIAVGIMVLLVMIAYLPLEAFAQQQRTTAQRANRLMPGVYLGLQTGTADDDVAAALGFSADYFLDEHFSLGPLFQFGFTGDLTQVGVSAQAKYTFDLPRVPELKPHLQGGLGFLHVDKDPPPFPGPGGDDSDLGFLIPFGGGFELEVTKNLLLGTALLLNYTDVDVDTRERLDNLFMSWFLGIRFQI